MTTSQQMSFLSEVLGQKEPIPNDTLVYFRERLRHRIHAAIVEAYVERAKRNKNLTQKDLADRVHRSESHVSRLLSSARNLTIDMISDVMVGLAMDFDSFPRSPIEDTISPSLSVTDLAAEASKTLPYNYDEVVVRAVRDLTKTKQGSIAQQEHDKIPDRYRETSDLLNLGRTEQHGVAQ